MVCEPFSGDSSMSTRLSRHFSLEEFISSSDSVAPGKVQIENLTRLCETALEPLRAVLGRALFISSGYRSESYNRRIGGAKGSQHCLGIAADIQVGSSTDDDTLIRAAARASKIDAIGGIGIYPGRGFIHVDIRPRSESGRPTWWLSGKKGTYGPLTSEIKEKLVKEGARL